MRILRIQYLVIIAVVAAVSALGGAITSGGMSWYRTIAIPSWTPPGSVIGIVWTIIYILASLSAIIVWNKTKAAERLWWIIGLFGANALLNVGWTLVFFGLNLPGWAVVEALVLLASVVVLIVYIRPVSRLAAVLLYPYAIWVSFATYLTFTIAQLN